LGSSLAVIVLIVVDVLGSLFYRTGSEAHVTVIGPRSGVTRRAIVILPGYLMPGQLVGEAFAPYIGPDNALVSVDYAERGVSVDDIYTRVRVQLDKLRPAQLTFYGASMGGMVSVLLADRYRQDGQPYGPPALILDSAPAARDDLKRPELLFPISCVFRGGPLSTVVWAVASSFGAKPPVEDGASRALADAAHHRGAWAGTPAAATQACFIGRFRPPQHATALVSRVVYLQTRSAAEDPVVRIPQSINHWRAVFPHLSVVMLSGRAGKWHLPLVEQPRETVAAILSAQP
jgi:pimeloyl-ACP methyl ester carboxylesterase